MRMYSLTINGNDYDVVIKEVTEEDIKVEVNGIEHIVAINKITNLSMPHDVQTVQPIMDRVETVQETSFARNESSTPSEGAICSPLPGHVLEIEVKEGEKVLVGQKLLVIEAMKLENIITADRTGVVKKILVSVGDAVNHGQSLVIVA